MLVRIENCYNYINETVTPPLIKKGLNITVSFPKIISQSLLKFYMRKLFVVMK